MPFQYSRFFFSEVVPLRPLMSHERDELEFVRRDDLVGMIQEHIPTLQGVMNEEEIRKMDDKMPNMRTALILYREMSHVFFNEKGLFNNSAFIPNMNQVILERCNAQFDHGDSETKIKHTF